jgi:dipeptidase E
MKKQIIAIGGGGFGRNPKNLDIESYVIDNARVSRPKICFIPTATGEDKSYIVNFYKAFSKLHCIPSHLEFFARTPDLRNLILDQDIVFVGGGNTKSMLAVWNEWGLPNLLKQAYINGAVLAGVSAGAICWFNRGVTDSWANSLKIMDCLGFVDGNCCPHYDEEEERRPAVNKFLKNGKLEQCYAIEGGCAIHCVDDEIQNAVSFAPNKKAFFITTHNGIITEKELKNLCIYQAF